MGAILPPAVPITLALVTPIALACWLVSWLVGEQDTGAIVLGRVVCILGYASALALGGFFSSRLAKEQPLVSGALAVVAAFLWIAGLEYLGGMFIPAIYAPAIWGAAPWLNGPGLIGVLAGWATRAAQKTPQG